MFWMYVSLWNIWIKSQCLIWCIIQLYCCLLFLIKIFVVFMLLCCWKVDFLFILYYEKKQGKKILVLIWIFDCYYVF